MDSIKINAYAKINLFLEVCGKRADSYHNIDSIMQSVSLCDVITVSKQLDITVTNNACLPNDSGNLAYKAAAAFFEKTGMNAGARIHIEKNIPISAGLAGGSTDAAATLRALNTLYEAGLTDKELCSIGASLGADVPFCILGGCFTTRGIGEIMTPCHQLPDCRVVIAKSGEGVSTPQAYGNIDKLRENTDLTFRTSDGMASVLEKGSLQKIAANMYNAFEEAILPIRPEVGRIKDIMYKSGCIAAMMSGSGPSVFGIFEDEEKAEKSCSALKEAGITPFICKPI